MVVHALLQTQLVIINGNLAIKKARVVLRVDIVHAMQVIYCMIAPQMHKLI